MMENGGWGGDGFHVSPTSAFALPHAATGTIVLGLLIPRNFIIVPVETHGRASLQSPVRFYNHPCVWTHCVFIQLSPMRVHIIITPCMFQQLSRCVRTNIPIRVPEINPVRVQTIIIVHISTIIPIHPCKCSRMFR